MKRRQVSLLALSLALAAVAPAVARADEIKLIGSGRQLPVPDLFDLVQGLQQGQRRRDRRLPGQGQRRRHPGPASTTPSTSPPATRHDRRGDRARSMAASLLLPMTAGEIVLAYNLPGVTELKLPRDVYPDIFLGKITSWNDPRIAAANPGVTLPDTNDHRGAPLRQQRHDLRVHQAPARHQRGVQEQVPARAPPSQWPTTRQHRGGTQERRRHRDDQADAGCHRLHRVRLRQADQGAGRHRCRTPPATTSPPAARAGRSPWPAPSSPAPTICAAGSTNPQAPEAYPITTFTWMLFYKKQDPAKAEVLRNLVDTA